MRLRLDIEYDGTDFSGWAAQPGFRTVEGTLREALGTLYAGFDDLAVAGRTDAGVHALGQVATVDVEGGPPAASAAEALNTMLPDDLVVTAAARGRRPTSTPATRPARARTATGSGGGGRRRRSSSGAAGGSRGRSTRRSSPSRPT